MRARKGKPSLQGYHGHHPQRRKFYPAKKTSGPQGGELPGSSWDNPVWTTIPLTRSPCFLGDLTISYSSKLLACSLLHFHPQKKKRHHLLYKHQQAQIKWNQSLDETATTPDPTSCSQPTPFDPDAPKRSGISTNSCRCTCTSSSVTEDPGLTSPAQADTQWPQFRIKGKALGISLT